MVDGLSSGNTRTYISSAAIAVIDKVVAKRTSKNNVSHFEISRKPVVRLNGKILSIGCVCYTTAIALSTVMRSHCAGRVLNKQKQTAVLAGVRVREGCEMVSKQVRRW